MRLRLALQKLCDSIAGSQSACEESACDRLFPLFYRVDIRRIDRVIGRLRADKTEAGYGRHEFEGPLRTLPREVQRFDELVSEVSRSENDDNPGESLSESPGTGFLMRLIRL